MRPIRACGCAWWEDDPLSPTGRRPRGEIESCAPDTADESPAECAEDVQEIAAILDAEVGISGESVVERCARRSARTSTSNLNQRALAWDAVAGHPLDRSAFHASRGQFVCSASPGEVGRDRRYPDAWCEGWTRPTRRHGPLRRSSAGTSPTANSTSTSTRQRSRAIQETRRHLDRDADRVAGNALRARKIAAMARAISG